LADGARLTAAVPQGAAITYDQVELVDSFALKLRKLQDVTVW
jgi:predicted homoserine dehydrogenase-like protein